MADDPALALVRIGATPGPWPGDALADEAAAAARAAAPLVTTLAEAPVAPPLRDSAGRHYRLEVEATPPQAYDQGINVNNPQNNTSIK